MINQGLKVLLVNVVQLHPAGWCCNYIMVAKHLALFGTSVNEDQL